MIIALAAALAWTEVLRMKSNLAAEDLPIFLSIIISLFTIGCLFGFWLFKIGYEPTCEPVNDNQCSCVCCGGADNG